MIFEDRDGDGKFETRKVFAEGLNLVSSIEVGYGGVWVGAAPQLLFIPDRNHDDIPDGPPEVLLDGFGFQDTHECLNSFLWGPDGWLYGNQGVFNYARIGKPGAPDGQRMELRAGVWRYHPVRHEFEVFAEGGSNPWGLDFDERGQLFMTHCRSYWGRGCATHVIQGGRFWNQANANYAPFIVANPPAEFPGFRNYLLASARVDHGAGGAGPRGSDAIYGGHSHAGTMIYLGDNWPDEYRGHLFTHNLGGHQMNHMVNKPLGSGFDTVNEGHDQFFCSDPKYVAVDLQYGPDGAVYIIDWYDQQHCHNPNTESWERGNGRIYRLEYTSTFHPVQVDLGALSDAKLAQLHSHKSEWFVRTARRLLHERSTVRAIDPDAVAALREMAEQDRDPFHRLRALWTLHVVGSLAPSVVRHALADSDPYVRGWAVQLSCERPGAGGVPSGICPDGCRGPLAERFDCSSLRAVQRLPEETAWSMILALAGHGEDGSDRNLPLLLWDGLALRMPGRLDRAWSVAENTKIPQLADFTHWYAATMEGPALNRAVAALDGLDGGAFQRGLAGLWLAMEPRANVPMPEAWKGLGPKLYASPDLRVRRQAERLAAVFGDASMFPRLRATLADRRADADARKHAFAVLSRAEDAASYDAFLGLLDDPMFRSQALHLLGRFDRAETPKAILERFGRFSAPERVAALNALTSRASFALALLDRISSNSVSPRSIDLVLCPAIDRAAEPGGGPPGDGDLGPGVGNQRRQTGADGPVGENFRRGPSLGLQRERGEEAFSAALRELPPRRERRRAPRTRADWRGPERHPLLPREYHRPGRGHRSRLPDDDGGNHQGEVVSGLPGGETASAVTLRTPSGEMVIPKAGITRREVSAKSLMPEGLLESLGDREQIELLKFLTAS